MVVYFLWGFVKDQVDEGNPQSIEALKHKIERVIREIQPELWQNGIENFDKRKDVSKRGRDGNFKDIIFHS